MTESRTTGLMVVDKPTGMTSHDVVERLRRSLRERIGHAGTLDPQATGVLLLCIGSATRLARFLQRHDKVYEGIVKLGRATDTYDAAGKTVGEPVAGYIIVIIIKVYDICQSIVIVISLDIYLKYPRALNGRQGLQFSFPP